MGGTTGAVRLCDLMSSAMLLYNMLSLQVLTTPTVCYLYNERRSSNRPLLSRLN